MWSKIGRRAELQHGVVSRDQLRELGIRDDAIDFAIAQGRLYPIFRGVYGVGHGPLGREGRLLAAVLACGPGAVVSHGTAASLLGLWEAEPRLIDVIAPVQMGRGFAGIKRRHTPLPVLRDRWRYKLIPCTSPSRTIIDVAGMVGERSLGRTVEQAAVRGMLNVPEIDSILAGPRRRGSRLLRLVLEDWRRYPAAMRIRSPLEARLLPLLTQWRIPVPRVNEDIVLGDDTFEIDFLWRRQRVVVETDGGKYHGHPLAQARDSHRNSVLRAYGYEVRRLSWHDLEDRQWRVRRELTRLLLPPET